MPCQGLPLRVATLLTGLLECLGFAGVLFGWASLVFVFKTEHYFEELCESNGQPMHNATGQAGKWREGCTRGSKSSFWGQELNKRDPHLSVHPDNLYVVKNKVSGCNPHISAALI